MKNNAKVKEVSKTPAGQACVLVVDDNEMNRDMLSRRLERKGYDVTVAHDGDLALELIRDHRFDLVLLDVTMPGMNGLEVLKILREAHTATDLPIIMATAHTQSEDIVTALALGANDYVTKPLDFPVVLARVRTHLALKRAAEQVQQLERSLAERNRELEQTNARLEKINGRMSHDLKAAAKIQETFLPHEETRVAGLAFAWIYRPCDELGGDGLNVIPLGERRVGLYILDVSGHGVASALLSVTLSRVLSPPPEPSSILVRDGNVPDRPDITPPAEVADRLNRLFPFDAAIGQFTTMLYGVLDAVTGEFRYVSAGHPGPVHLPAGAGPVILEGQGLPIGLAEDAYEERSVRLAAGDRLYLYSDGVPEAMDPVGEQFGYARLRQAIGRVRFEPLQEGVAALLKEVERWRGAASAQDDITILAVEVSAAAGRGEPGVEKQAGGPLG
ncbi:MAG: PP2C family protein-serine/threonine phosphatase [Thermoguttaceae bacterium]